MKKLLLIVFLSGTVLSCQKETINPNDCGCGKVVSDYTVMVSDGTSVYVVETLSIENFCTQEILDIEVATYNTAGQELSRTADSGKTGDFWCHPNNQNW